MNRLWLINPFPNPHTVVNHQASRLLSALAWALLLVAEERAHTDPDQGRCVVGAATTTAGRRFYRLPGPLAGFYALAFVGAGATLAALLARDGGTFDAGNAEVS